MLALRKIAPAPGIALVDVPRPVAGADEVRLRVEAAGICGTDLHIAHWHSGYATMAGHLPVTLGHEAAGTVIEGPPDWLGRRAVIRPSVACDSCETCGETREDRCTRREGIGIRRAGAFAQEIVVPLRNLVAVPAGMEPELAALAEPLSVSLEAVQSARIRPGDRVLVVGPGPIGLAASLFAGEAGAAALVLAGRDDGPRLRRARKLGIKACVDSAGTTLVEALAAGGQPASYEVILEAAGVPALIPQLQQLLAPFGRLVVAGIHDAPAPIDLTALVRGHQRLLGTYRAPVALWQEVLRWIAAHPERARGLITHRVQLKAIESGFAAMESRAAVKVMVRFDASP